MPEIKDSTNPEIVELMEHWEELDDQQVASDLEFLVEIPQFRRYFWHILSYCRMFRVNFTGNSWQNLYEGMRAVGVYLTQQVDEVAPDAYITMLKEVKERKVQRDAAMEAVQEKATE